MRILGTKKSGEFTLIAAGKFIPVKQGKPQLAFHTFFEFCLDCDNKAQLLEYGINSSYSHKVDSLQDAYKLILRK